MSGGFWKSIGSKLVDAGQAYVQQVRFINELKQLPPTRRGAVSSSTPRACRRRRVRASRSP